MPPPDVSAIEAIIYNQHTTNFAYAEVVEEQPHMKTFGNSYSTKKEKGKVFQMSPVWFAHVCQWSLGMILAMELCHHTSNGTLSSH